MPKLKLKELNANPFKKEIDGGKLNKNQVEKIKSSIKELGLMGTLPVVKIKNKWHLIYGHHRLQALKELYGKNKEVDITIQSYSEDQLLRGMVMENLTQRTDDFKEIVQNLKCVRNHLKKQPTVQTLNSRRDSKGRLHGKDQETGSISHLSDWLNKQGEVLSRGSISEHLSVADNLSPELYNSVEKTHSGDADRRTNGKTISKSQAIILSRIKDKKEQKEIAKALHNSKENRVRDQSHLITEYKKAPKEIQEKVRKGKLDLADIQFESHKLGVGNFSLKRSKMYLESHIELRDALKKMFCEKLFIKKSPSGELETTYHYIINWIKADLIPFMKEIENELKKKGSEEKIIYYDLVKGGLKK